MMKTTVARVMRAGPPHEGCCERSDQHDRRDDPRNEVTARASSHPPVTLRLDHVLEADDRRLETGYRCSKCNPLSRLRVGFGYSGGETRMLAGRGLGIILLEGIHILG